MFDVSAAQHSSTVPWKHARSVAADWYGLTGSPSGLSGFVSLPSRSPLLLPPEDVLDFAAFMSPTPSEAATAHEAMARVSAWRAGLLRTLSSAPAVSLYDISVTNGLEMPYQQWLGKALDISGAPVALTGGFLLLRPGINIDIPLPTGISAGVGRAWNFSNFSIQVTATNTTAAAKTPVITVVAFNAGFMESAAGVTPWRASPFCRCHEGHITCPRELGQHVSRI